MPLLKVRPRMHDIVAHEPFEPQYPAFAYFNAYTFRDARRAATAYLRRVRCLHCKHLIEHRFERIGSTLFFDENPRLLAEAFDPDDRDECTATVLAACILVYGRERIPIE